MRKDAVRKKANKVYETAYKKLMEQVTKAKKSKNSADLLKKAYQAIAKAAKRGIIHKNKANRLKSQVARKLKK